MIAYFLGIPGSGKSYYGVNVIYDNFAKDVPKKTKLILKKDYKNCYTNINEFNFKLTKKVYQFDFDEFFKHIKELHKMYKAKATDAQLIEKSKEFKIYKTLFVIDECHNYFDTPKIELIWWLTYHRHLYHDIYLITQDLGLINTRYKPLAEAYYKAKPNSLTLDKRFFNYMYYTNSRLSKSSYVDTKKVKRNKEVFKLYKSGDSVKSKNVILKFIKISIFLFILLMFAGWYFFYSMQNQSVSENTPGVNIKSESHKIAVSDKVPGVISSLSDSSVHNDNSDYDDDNILLLFRCNYDKCIVNNQSFDSKLFEYSIDRFNINIIRRKHFLNMNFFTVSINKKFLDFIKGGNDDFQAQDNISLFSDTPISK